jgi:ABC-2 type transport system permease protein
MTDVTTARPAPARAVVPIREVDEGFHHDFRTIKVVWQRELIRFTQDRIRIITALVQPVLYLFVLGTGLSNLVSGASGGVNFRTFMFPGVIGLSVLFTAVFSAVTIVWDREFGFLREMLVAPVRRGALITGKALGGATVATLQGCIVLALAGAVGVPYNALMLLELLVIMFFLAFTLTSLGLVMAARVQQIQSVMGLMQMLLMPLYFLSGSLYPVGGLPTWLATLVHINPVTYAVHPIRQVVFDHINASAAARAKLNPPLTWWGWSLPIPVQLAVVAFIGILCLVIAIVQFSRPE